MAIYYFKEGFCIEEQTAVDEVYQGVISVKDVKRSLKHKRTNPYPKYLAKPARMYVRIPK